MAESSSPPFPETTKDPRAAKKAHARAPALSTLPREFAENQEEAEKQDCEPKAFHQLRFAYSSELRYFILLAFLSKAWYKLIKQTVLEPHVLILRNQLIGSMDGLLYFLLSTFTTSPFFMNLKVGL